MTSSTITGDRRWTSARRGGMTVLGKVAVPKPINLPSQRLENHGLDPNVEIVPKGTLSWGSRPSSAGSNAWGTSALSPSTDGGSSSPSHVVGRPSSGGGTRPSTAGSEKALDSNVNAWGSNSRPSSASGGLPSSHTSTSLRPRSAETRPGSSHLSRFAEPTSEGTGAWSATSVPERMGVSSSATEGFSLSTGDFPTLGSEKDESKRSMESSDDPFNGQPDSSADVRTMTDSRGIIHSDEISRNSYTRGNSWRKDGPSFVEDGPRPSMERWHGEPHLYPNPNMAPHYESWRGGPPVNPPGGVWFRGPPAPPYGGPVRPGGFPIEPFPYYHPQVPAPGLVSSQPMHPNASHFGHHPKNGDMPRMPHVPHMHPGMPMRPGFYPGPVSYDGYYRPPIGLYNPVHGRHGPDISNVHPESREGRGPEHFDPGHPHNPCGPYKVVMNPNDGWNQNEEEKWGNRMNTSAVNREKGILSKPSPQLDNAWGDDYKKDEDIREASSHSSNNKMVSVNPSNLKFPERSSNIDGAQTSPSMENVSYPQDQSLIQKIEGLNAKARAVGGKQEGFHISHAKDQQSANEANSDVILERHPTGILVPIPCNSDTLPVDNNLEPKVASVTTAPRKFGRGTQSRGDPHAKGRFHGMEADGWGKKIDSHPVFESGSRSTTNDEMEDHKNNIMSNVDVSDMQRAKMREIAKQRAIQLQKEEEERVREQKAKALAKLEELNRRSANQSVESSGQKEAILPPGDAPKKREFSRNLPEPSVESSQSTGSNSASFNNIAQIDERNTSKISEPEIHNQLPTGANVDEANSHKTGPQFREASRQKRGGYKERQNVTPEKNNIKDSVSSGKADVLKDIEVTSSSQEVSGNFVNSGAGKQESESAVSAEVPVQKKKVNKSGKNMHKIESSSSTETSGHVNFIPDPKDASRSSDIVASEYRDDTQGKVNNAGKSQHFRKPRNTQGNRSSDKTHSNDATFWAPVRSHNKLEVVDKSGQKDSEPLLSSPIGDNLVPNSSKTKRAEMERYVAKPVVKEIAQQESCGREKVSQGSENAVKAGANVETKHVDGKNRHQRGQGSWRQRVSIESTSVQSNGSQLNAGFDVSSVGPPPKLDENSKKEPQLDGWGFIIDDFNCNTSDTYDVAKDHAPFGRGKRHSSKGQKGGGNYQDSEHKDSNPEQSSHVDPKESHIGGDHSSSHWQPKSQSYVAHNQQGNRSRGSQNFAIKDPILKPKDKGAGQGKPSLGHQEAKRERRVGPVKGHPHSPSQETEAMAGEVEPTSFEPMDGQNEPHPSSGYRKNANYNGRVNRANDSRSDWISTGQENKQHFSSARERQRQNSHYEYQPVGPFNGSSRSNEPVVQTENQSGASKYRERGQGHSRRGRGNSYVRQSGNE